MRFDPLDAEFVSGACRGVGVVVALAGSFMAIPDATLVAFRRGRARLVRWWLAAVRVRGLLAAWLPFLRRNATIDVRTGHGAAGVAAATATAGNATVRIWSPSAPVDQRIELLRQRIDDLDNELNALRAQQRSDVADLQSRLGDLKARLDHEVGQVRETLMQKEKEAVDVDWRALPVIAFGVVLSGIPDELSRPWWLGWTFVAVALAVLYPRVFSVLRLHWWKPKKI